MSSHVTGERDRCTDRTGNMTVSVREQRLPTTLSRLVLVAWVLAGVSVFLPIALNTSPWDALNFNVPGNQGNWWHAVIGAQYLLAYPAIWLHARSLGAERTRTKTGQRVLWGVLLLSALGTVAVQLPFVLHRAGTSELQRLAIIGTGFGFLLTGAVSLFKRRERMSPAHASLVGLSAANLANASLCLIVYGAVPGPIASRLGWLVTLVIVWPIVLEMFWLIVQA
jgi:hypothetical protein